MIDVPLNRNFALATVGIALIIVIWMYTSTLLAVGTGAVLVLVALYIAYVVLYRVDRFLKHGGI